MDFNDPQASRVFFDVHHGLPREGSGNRDCTARALALARPLPENPRILDIACGPGMQTMHLAALLPTASIVALDRHPPFLAEVQRRAVAGGAADRIATVLGDMAALPFPAGSFDLIWCEGAAYVMGLAQALRAWRPLLRRGGRLALTEAVWLRPDAPETVRRCRSADYPGMGDIEACRRIVREAGYAPLGDFVLPESAWWEDYYAPMQERLAALAPRYDGDAAAAAVLRACREEIETYRRFAAYDGYMFLVMSAGPPSSISRDCLHKPTLWLQQEPAMPPETSAQIFTHIRIVMGIALGLGITRLLTGTAQFVQHPQRRRVYWVHLGWVLFMLVSLSHYWWWEFWLYAITDWTYEFYFFLIAYTVLLYFLCALLFPDDVDEYGGFEEYFISRRKWYFGLLALTFIFDFVDTLMKGAAHFERYGVEYLVRTPIYVALCVTAMLVVNRKLHAAFVIGSLIYEASRILRLFRTLT